MNGPLDYVSGASGPAVTMDPYLLMGLGMLSNVNQPGGAGMAQGALQGLQAYQQAQAMEVQNAAARAQLAQAGKWGDYVAGLPAGQRELLGALGPSAGATYLTEQMKQQSGGAWEGSGFQAQAANMYNALMAKVQAGIPLTPEEEANLSIAYQSLTAPKTLTTAEGTYTYPGMQLPGVPGMAGSPGVVGPGQTPGEFTPKPATEGERKAASLYSRMSRANEALAELEAVEGFDPSAFSGRAVKDFIGGRMKESGGPFSSLFGALITSDEYNLYTSAAGDFIASMLRYDSGAAVPDTEFYRYYGTYFPLPGEGPAVRLAKAQRRTAAAEALRVSAGRGLDEAERRKEAERIRSQILSEIPLPKEAEAPAPAASAAPVATPAAPPAEDEDEVEVFY